MKRALWPMPFHRRAPGLRLRHFTSLSDRPFQISMEAEPGAATGFAMSLHKAGSVLLDGVIADICAAAGQPKLDLEPQLFKQGVPMGDCPIETMLLLEREGYIYHGFRGLWLLPHLRLFRRAAKILLVRDPRDIAVSYYFSMRDSHIVPAEGATRDAVLAKRSETERLDVNDYVASGKADPVIGAMQNYMWHMKRHEGIVRYRYEDIIFAKEAWVADICAQFGLSLAPERIAQIARKHDIVPDAENPARHIRQVHPGNYKKHLSEDAARRVKTRFSAVFDYFGYE